MASGRMEFHAETIMAHTNVSFVLPNDVYMPEVRDLRHYKRPTGTLILLHGLTGTDTDWLFGGLAQEMAIQYNMAVFMPTTGNSFYLDRGYVGGNYGQFIGEELPEYITKTFGYCTARENTIIGGLSMGGYGALHTALAYPERFSGCIALSSALVIHEIAKFGTRMSSIMPREMVLDVFGDPETVLTSDKNPEVQYRALQASGRPIPKIYFACGTEDMLLDANRDFRDFLAAECAAAGVDAADRFCYEEGPGAHNWFFWREYIDRGLAKLLNA